MSKPMPLEEGELEGRQASRYPDGFLSVPMMIGILIGAATVLLVWGLSGWFASVPSIRADRAEIVVSYTVQDTPTTSRGGKIEDVSSIEFFPNYLVVKSGDRSGHVYFGEQTQQFSWFRRPDSSSVPIGR